MSLSSFTSEVVFIANSAPQWVKPEVMAGWKRKKCLKLKENY